MPSPITALTLLKDALALTNAVGSDQTLTADETADSLRKLNDLVEIFSTQNLAVYGQANQSFNTVAGQSVYTIGTGGNWATTRPVRINDPCYSTYQGVAFPLVSMTQAEYNSIAVKTQQQEFPERYLYVNEYPLGLVTLYPVPSSIVPVTLSIDRVLSQVASAATTLSFPPGYAMVFTYQLGVMLAPLFGKKMTDYPDVMKIAAESFANIKRANRKLTVMRIDPAYLGENAGGRNWYRGW